VAIKVLHAQLAASADAGLRLVREAQAVNQVAHPGVVDVFAYGRLDDGRTYLVMDLVDGETVRARLRRGPLPPAVAVEVIDAIARALDAAHARGVVHRDLKPDNVMVHDGPPLTVKVLDFGIAKLRPQAGAPSTATLTAQGSWMGTPAYMAPEQWSADGATAASDRYALGGNRWRRSVPSRRRPATRAAGSAHRLAARPARSRRRPRRRHRPRPRPRPASAAPRRGSRSASRWRAARWPRRSS
jgi:serine/threonine protein kinase